MYGAESRVSLVISRYAVHQELRSRINSHQIAYALGKFDSLLAKVDTQVSRQLAV